MGWARYGLLIAAFAAAGCVDPGPEASCQNDLDCDGVCTNTFECWPADSVLDVRVFWQVDGQTPNATTCEGITHLALEFEGSLGVHRITPIECDLRFITFPKIPSAYSVVDLEAYAGDTLIQAQGQALMPSGRTDLLFDLPSQVPQP